jgi:ribosomal protein S18 acetylase RimI-like enzyme
MDIEDLGTVCELYLEANQFTNKDKILEWTYMNLKAFPQYHLVYEENNRIISAISGTAYKKGFGCIEDISVQKEFRKQHIGNYMIKELLNQFKKNEVNIIELFVHSKSFDALEFYLKNGFEINTIDRMNGDKYVPDGEVVIFLKKYIF